MSRVIRSEYLVLLFSALMMAGYNQSLWLGIIAANHDFTLHTGLFLVSCAVFLTALFNLLFNFFALGKVVKPALIVIVFCSSVASFFIDNYGVHIDSSMLQNVIETDTAEATELFSTNFLLHILLWGVLPALVLYRLPIYYDSWRRHTIKHLFAMTMSLLAMSLVAAFFYQDYASTFRNHRDLRYLINPTNYVYATGKIVSMQFASTEKTLIPIAQDVKRGSLAENKHHRTITVVVVGETARAEQFHLDGYTRQTTPELEKYHLVNFEHVSSCGTSTAVSLPCMFSKFSRNDYTNEKGHRYENLLDVVAASGTAVIWLDNNSGCKGICERVEHQKVNHLPLPTLCNKEECFDEVLLSGLDQTLASHQGDVMIVLHQKGSHGPAYYKRIPERYKQFLPVCETSELQQCSQQQLINAYDNTILYTDKVLSEVIDYLQSKSSDNDTAMLYLSDHGESLGEHNLFLHGTPYLFAPSQQTHIPMMLWLSESYKDDYQINEGCLQNQQHAELSQDNLFHSLLGMMNIDLPGSYDANLDIFSTCHVTNSRHS